MTAARRATAAPPGPTPAPTCRPRSAIAVSGDEIWVAGGTYKPGASGARTATFQLRNGVAVYGGFAGTETSRAARDWAANPTLLSGDLDGSGGLTDSDAYHVVTGSGTDATAVLDGFTIRGGNANGSYPDNRGGGMHQRLGQPDADARHLQRQLGDLLGGGMYNYASSPTLTNVAFSGNSATGDGGGMYNSNSSSPALTNVTFSGNSGDLRRRDVQSSADVQQPVRLATAIRHLQRQLGRRRPHLRRRDGYNYYRLSAVRRLPTASCGATPPPAARRFTTTPRRRPSPTAISRAPSPAAPGTPAWGRTGAATWTPTRCLWMRTARIMSLAPPTTTCACQPARRPSTPAATASCRPTRPTWTATGTPRNRSPTTWTAPTHRQQRGRHGRLRKRLRIQSAGL